MKKIIKQSGFTLIETMTYFAIASLFLFAITMFSLQILNTSKLSENIHEIQSSSNFSTNKIAEKIRLAASVNTGSSVFDNDNGVLNLNGSPSVSFYLQNQNIYVTEGGGNPVKLNSDTVKVIKLRFHRITSPKVPDQIVIDGEFSSVSTINNLIHNYLFHITVSLRR